MWFVGNKGADWGIATSSYFVVGGPCAGTGVLVMVRAAHGW